MTGAPVPATIGALVTGAVVAGTAVSAEIGGLVIGAKVAPVTGGRVPVETGAAVTAPVEELIEIV